VHRHRRGGSGGALAIAVGDVVMMLQYATYSVISPEGCASILWKSADRAPRRRKRWHHRDPPEGFRPDRQDHRRAARRSAPRPGRDGQSLKRALADALRGLAEKHPSNSSRNASSA